MSKAIMISVNKPYTDSINDGSKKCELRLRVPKIPTPFKVYTYETKKGNGSGKVVNEWICDDITTWRMCVGIPQNLLSDGCISADDIWKYCHKGEKDIKEMHISNLKVYDQPKELSKFGKEKAPQSWCYVEELKK